MTESLTTSARAPDTQSGRPLLEVTDLRISIPTEAGLIEAVRGVSFSMQASIGNQLYQNLPNDPLRETFAA